jgi:hypothetical protein
MAESFILTAYPTLLSEVTGKGHLEFVTFIASDRTRTEKWTSVNTGTFAEDFAKILPPAAGQNRRDRGQAGETAFVSPFRPHPA